MNQPKALSIAGFDPTGGAGVLADLKVYSDFNLQGYAVVSASTIQTEDVYYTTHPMPVNFISRQMSILLEKYSFSVIKVGMVYKKAIFDCIYRKIKKIENIPIIVDPVLQSSTGRSLIQEKAKASLKKLISESYIVTPNLMEASILTGIRVNNIKTMQMAARALYTLGPKYVLIKGGHLKESPHDILFDGNTITHFEGLRIEGSDKRGLGCRLSSAIAALLAHKRSLVDAILEAKKYVENYISQSIK